MKAKESKLDLPKALEGFYVIVSKDGNLDYTTLRCQRKTSIEAFLDLGFVSWDLAKEHGWRCVKVDVFFYQKYNKLTSNFLLNTL